MIDQLRKIAESIDQLLAEDEFPFSIRPDYLAEAVRAYPVRGGKRLRPALLIWSCGLLGGDEAKALYPAAAVEVYHNWTLVHDDIIDRERTAALLSGVRKQLSETAGRLLERNPVFPCIIEVDESVRACGFPFKDVFMMMFKQGHQPLPCEAASGLIHFHCLYIRFLSVRIYRILRCGYARLSTE